MISFRDAPINRKLTLVITLTSSIALAAAGTLFLLSEFVSFRRAMVRDVTTLAQLVGANSSAALVFDDPRTVQENLSPLRSKPQIVSACVYTTAGKVLGSFARDAEEGSLLPPTPGPEGARFGSGQLVVIRKVMLEGEPVGTVYIKADLREMTSRLRAYALTVLMIMAAAGLVSFLASYKLRQVVSTPILRLAEAAAEIGKGRLQTRIAVESGDEIGTLARSFNQMAEDLSATTVSRDFVDKVLHSMADTLLVVSPGGTIHTVNEATLRLLGYEKEELVGQQIQRILEAHPFGAPIEAVLLKEGVLRNLEIQFVTKDGRRIPVSFAGSIMRDEEGRIQAVVCVAQDITERKAAEEKLLKYYAEVEQSRRRAEQQAAALARQAEDLTEARNTALEATRMKSEFLANMSHEIRTPMNGVIGMTELALDTELAPEQREYLEMVQLSANSLLSLLNDILDFSKIEAGRMDLESIAFRLRGSLSDTLKPLTVRARSKGLDLASEISSEVPDRLLGDPGRLRQVLLNLVGNAVKFTDEGAIVVRVRAEEAPGRPCVLHFEIADTGIGIAMEKHRLIFEPFRQGDGSTTRRYGGTGLGLTICSQIVGLMGGRIWVESEPGRGSTFHFTACFGVPEIEPVPAPQARTSELRGLRVLVVDDDTTHVRIVSDMLGGLGMRPESARELGAVVGLLQGAREERDPFRLVLLDVQMPGEGGFAVAKRIRAGPEGESVAIVILTSTPQRGDAARCRDLGIAAYLAKPLHAENLAEALLAVIGEAPGEEGKELVTLHSLREARSRLRILVADDDRVNRALVARLLDRRGHSVLAVPGGQEVIRALAGETFDAVLLDLQMPGMDGFETATAIQAAERERGGRVPIVALTAHAANAYREKCLEAGMVACLAKPVVPKELYATVEAFCAEERSGRGGGPSEATGTARSGGAGALDRASMLASVESDPSLLAEIVELTLEELPKQVAALREALSGGDLASVGRIAHMLKGTFGAIAAGPGLAAAEGLEEAAGSGHPDRIAEALADLENAVGALEPELEALAKRGVLS